MRHIFGNKIFLYGIGIVIFFAIWGIVSLCIGNTVSLFPDPISTIKESFFLLGEAYFYKCLGATLLRMIIGFGIALILALVLGIFAGHYKKLQTVFSPTMTIMKAVPTAALVFLFLMLLKAKNAPILIVVLICMPILYEAIIGGFNNIDPNVIDAASVDGGNPLKTIFMVKLPLSMPSIIIGVASSFALSLKIEIMAEVVSGDTGYGLGVAISTLFTKDPSNLVPIFAYAFLTIVIALIITALSKLVKKLLTKKVA